MRTLRSLAYVPSVVLLPLVTGCLPSEPPEPPLTLKRTLAAGDIHCDYGGRPAAIGGPPTSPATVRETSLILMTGSPEGSYQAIGCGIAQVIENATGRRVILVNSDGSRENLLTLLEGQADLVLTQGDVAHHAYTGEAPFEEPGSGPARLFTRPAGRRIRAIVGLHYEQVMAIGRNGLSSLTDLEGTRVVIGADSSGTIGNAREVLHVLEEMGITPDTLIVGSSRAALPQLADSTVDVVFLTNPMDEALRRLIDGYDSHVLPMSEDLLKHLGRVHPYYHPDTDSATPATVRIRAMLVANRRLPDETVIDVLEAIHRDIGSSNSVIWRTHAAAERDIIDDTTLTRDVSVPIHRAAAEIFCADEGTACAYTRTFQLMAGSAVALIVIGSFLFGIAFVAPVRRQVLRFFPRIALSDAFGSGGFVARWRWLLIPVFALTVILSGALAIASLEIVHSLETGASSAFTNRHFLDSVVWMIVFTASGYENQTFPVSLLAQITSAATVVIALGGVLFLVGVVTSDGFARRMRMDLREDPKRLSSHIVICGWNARAPAIVKILCGPGTANRRLRVVIVAELDFDPIDRFGLPERQTLHVRGSPMKLANFEAAELARADTVVILSSDDAPPEDRDAKTMAIATLAEKYVQRLMGEGKRSMKLHTVAELADADNREMFEAAFIDQILCRSEFDERLLAHSVLNPGLTHFMEEILTEDERSEIYEVPAGAGNGSYLGRTFDEALVAGRTEGLLLLAINRQRQRRARPDSTGAAAAAHRVTGLLTNPVRPDEREYRIRSGDSLLFLAPDQTSLEAVFGDADEWRTALLFN